MSEKNNELFQMINQARSEARSDSIRRFFGKNSKLIARASIVVVACVVAYSGYSLYRNGQQEKFSEIFHQALIDQQLGNLDKAKESLKNIHESSAPSGVKSLASMRYAALLLDENKKIEAAEIYKQISECRSCDVYIRDLGGLLAVKTWLSDESESKKDDLLGRIEKIESDNKELHFQVSEQKAFFYVQKNDLAKAYEVLDSVAKSPELPQNIKTRVEDSLKMIVAKGYQPAAEAVSTTTESKK